MILVVDTENTIYNNGNPFDQRNFNVCISYCGEDGIGKVAFEDRDDFKRQWEAADYIIGFNLKYDLHWLRRCGFSLEGKRFWCSQVCEFVLERQQTPYPSLDDCALRYNLGCKLDEVAEYWKKGIQTNEIPRDVLEEYAKHDVELTYALYKKQQERIQPHQRTLLSLCMQDLAVLQEMEWNGLHFDKGLSLKKSEELETEISQIQSKLSLYHTIPSFNWASNAHLSALLYGGTIVEDVRVHDGFYKTGKKVGQPKFRIEQVTHHLPRRYTPVKGSELAKEGQWSVEENYLKKLKGKNQELIDGILKIKKLQKLNNTYFKGLPALHEEMFFEENIIHGQFNQCVARTGRLSSSKPNLQNLEDRAQEVFTSRYI